jgi:putative transcriptional regulator
MMVEVLQNKNSATRFQIMAEIASAGPNIHQKNIALKLGISPQAVSEYVRQLSEEKLLTAESRSSYKISIEGVNWMLKILRELNDFLAEATSAVKNITTCAAIAEYDIARGQVVGLQMKDGLLIATTRKGTGAKGVAVTGAKAGEDVGVSNIQGLVTLKKEEITVFEVPSVQKGGSRKIDISRLKTLFRGRQQTGAIGIEAIASLRKAGIEPRYLYGVTEAAIELARCGLDVVIAATSDAIPDLIKKLRESDLDCGMVSLAPRSNPAGK